MQNVEKEFVNEFLFETSWEVCNKIGGIYTVLSTKAAELNKLFGDRLLFIGPNVWTDENPSPDFKEYKSLLKGAKEKLQLPFDISIKVGRWQVPGNPLAILVDYKPLLSDINRIFGEMWQDFGVDSLHAYGDYAESCAFAVASAITIKALVAHLKLNPSKILAHFDEWTTGMGLLYLKKHLPQAATIFTTHATSIGRSICSNGKPLYEYFTAYNGNQMAQELNMEAKHSLEKTAAEQADCFTTVSDVTAAECKQLLGVAPQVVTPNGFNSDFVPQTNKYLSERKKARTKILKTASALCGVQLNDETLIVATSGRNEYRNKGLDLFIDAMTHVGQGRKIQRRVLALILVPAWTSEVNATLINKLNGADKELVWPSFSTHRLYNEKEDGVFKRLQHIDSSVVTFMYVPCYLDGNDGVLNIPYYKLLPGVDVTVFPSYYEPWGYTPLESVAFSIPTITTNKSGFGQWVSASFPNNLEQSGVGVVERNDSDYTQSAKAISNIVEQIAELASDKLSSIRNAARNVAANAGWDQFISNYNQAYKLAMKSATKRIKDIIKEK